MTVADRVGLIDHIESLPPLPAIVHRVMTVIGSPDSSADDVARVLGEDQAIAAKILRVANSSFYGTSRQVTQISRAVVTLGTVGVRNLILGIAARDVFAAGTAQASEHTTLWQLSIATASAAELIAREVGFKPPEEAFVTGLLHDIGQLAMFTFSPESFRAGLREQRQGADVLTVEREHFGIDHTEAGFEILTRWGLPEPMCMVVRRHHEQEIDREKPSARVLAVVMFADTIAQVMGFGFDMPAGNLHRAEYTAQFLGLSETGQLHVVNALNGRINQAVEMFAGVDATGNRQSSPPSKRAVWVDSGNVDRACISQLLLEHCGYEVLRPCSSDLAEKLPSDDFVIVAPSKDGATEDLVRELVQRGHRSVVLLSDQADEGATRRRDKDTGVYHIPRVFTAFDIRWIEEHSGDE